MLNTMKSLISSLLALLLLTSLAEAQKGVDSQNQKIQKEATRTTDKGGDVSRSWSFGAGKTQSVDRLPNPLRLSARRDVLIENIVDVLQEMKIAVDETTSRPTEGFLVTQPYIFAKGAVITKNELNRYGIITATDATWTRGRFTLIIEVQSIDGIQNNVSVTAKIEGRSENGLLSEWITMSSSGEAEDRFLAKLVETVTGKTPSEYNKVK